jgi:gamma-tubulin complex component 2
VEPYLERPTCDFSLMFLVNKMLPLCNNHDLIQEFVNVHSQFEFGLVSHALCGSIRILLKEYLLLVTQLDTEFNNADLTLQKVWFYVQNSMRIMESLKRLVVEAGNKKGGALLNVIYRLMINSSDKSIRDLFEFILEKSSVPYISILKKWIFEGILDDHFEEFIVKENFEFKKEQVSEDLNNLYWLERFTFREDMIPNFLLKYKEKVLHTGKYLNVIRECGVDIKYEVPQEEAKEQQEMEPGVPSKY